MVSLTCIYTLPLSIGLSMLATISRWRSLTMVHHVTIRQRCGLAHEPFRPNWHNLGGAIQHCGPSTSSLTPSVSQIVMLTYYSYLSKQRRPRHHQEIQVTRWPQHKPPTK